MDNIRIHRLLGDCLSIPYNSRRGERLKRLSHADWDALAQQAHTYFVAPMLYYYAKTYPSDIPMPADLLSRLQHLYLTHVARNTSLFQEFVRLLHTLQKAQISVIALKGAYLAENVYGNIGLRQMSDIDLLVKKRDLAHCQRVLLQAGFLTADAPCSLDLHWTLDLSIANLHIPINQVWETAEPATVCGVETLGLSVEDLVLHTCSHLAFHHTFQRVGIRSLCDLREILVKRGSLIDWELLSKRAHAWGIERCVALTLVLAKEFLHAPLPERFADTFRSEEMTPEIREWAIRQLSGDTVYSSGISPFFLEFFVTTGWRKKLPLLKKLCVPSLEFVSQKYPAAHGSPQNYLYYLRRFQERTLFYVRLLWKMTNGDPHVRRVLEQQRTQCAMRTWLLSG